MPSETLELESAQARLTEITSVEDYLGSAHARAFWVLNDQPYLNTNNHVNQAINTLTRPKLHRGWLQTAKGQMPETYFIEPGELGLIVIPSGQRRSRSSQPELLVRVGSYIEYINALFDPAEDRVVPYGFGSKFQMFSAVFVNDLEARLRLIV